MTTTDYVVIDTELSHIARDLVGKDPFKSGYARAFINTLSKLPLYLASGELFEKPEDEATYLDTMSDLENLLVVYRKDKPRVQTQVDTLTTWLSNSNFAHNKHNCTIRFIDIIMVYRNVDYTTSYNHPLCVIGRIFEIISKIIRGHNTGPKRDALIREFDKYMRNLAIVGFDGVCAAYPGYTKITPRIPLPEPMYVASIGDPHFDIARFLSHGPCVLSFYVLILKNSFNIILNVVQDALINPVEYKDIGRFYRNAISAVHGWQELSHDEQNRCAKIMFPEPATIIDMLCIPF